VEQEQRSTLTGQVPAASGYVYGTSASRSQVVVYYAGELARLGWIHDLPPIVSTTEEQGEAWCKVGRTFRLAFDTQPVPGTPAGGRSFTAVIVARRSACPTVLPSVSPFVAPTAPPRSP
jgi:hypothetical protein